MLAELHIWRMSLTLQPSILSQYRLVSASQCYPASSWFLLCQCYCSRGFSVQKLHITIPSPHKKVDGDIFVIGGRYYPSHNKLCHICWFYGWLRGWANSAFCCRDGFVFHNKEKAKENKFWFDSFLLVICAKYVGDSSTDKATYTVRWHYISMETSQ